MNFFIVIEFLTKLYDFIKKASKKLAAYRFKKTIDEGMKSGDQREIEKMLNGSPVHTTRKYRGMYTRKRKKRNRRLDD